MDQMNVIKNTSVCGEKTVKDGWFSSKKLAENKKHPYPAKKSGEAWWPLPVTRQDCLEE